MKLLNVGLFALVFCLMPVSSNAEALIKIGAACIKINSTLTTSGYKYTCIKSGKKLIWGKAVKVDKATQTPIPTSTPTSVSTSAMQKITLSSFVSAAQSAIANPESSVPIFDPSGKVTIAVKSRNGFANFLAANTPDKFSFFGPTPLMETDASRAGSLSLITLDNRKVYGSYSALPPWAVGFKLSTTDSQGRFNLVTSGSGDLGQTHAWRLAYKEGSGIWKYQSISGVSHPNDNQKHFDEVSLGAPGSYSIRLEFEAQTTFYGLGLSDNASSVTPLLNSSAVRVLVVGDSWVWPSFEESGPLHVWDGYPGALSWLSGWNVISAGVRGQGYLSISANETYKDRIVRDVIPQHPSVVIFTGSSNDHLFSDQQIAEEMGRDIRAVQEANPGVLIIVCSPYETGGDQKASGQNQAMKAEAMRIGVPYIDFINLPLFDQTNNGQQQLSKGHPTRLGSSYIARILLKEIAAINSH
jgi:lysophospholipase L1-like esterase